MNFSYKSADLGKIIKKYFIKDDKIYVIHLDGTVKMNIYSKELEEEIKKTMVKQAIERTISNAPKEVAENIKQSFDGLTTKFFLTSGTLASMLFVNNPEIDLMLGIAGTILAAMALMHGINYKISTNDLDELVKYDIYLAIKDSLDNNSILAEKLNINTIDRYSLNDLKKIKECIELLQLQKRAKSDEGTSLIKLPKSV